MPFTVRLAHQNNSFIVNDDETILDAALRQNVDIPHSCCEGICGSCEGQIIDGNITYSQTENLVLDEADRAQGRALFCSAKAASDLLIDIPGCTIGANSISQYEYILEKLDPIGDDIYQAILSPKDKAVEYLAGQYIEVFLPEQEPKPFSIANAPNPQQQLELHIRVQANNIYAAQLIEWLKTHKTLQIAGPKGRCFYHPQPQMPMILLAVGTGFAPIKAIIEAAFADHVTQSIDLFWGGKIPQDIYEFELVKQWEKQYPNFHCYPILASDQKFANWKGEYGNILEAVIQHRPQLHQHHIYFGGPIHLTTHGLEKFTEHGAQTCYMYSDAFDLI